ncbi:IS5 family transposase, partial [Methyloglobulus morosus]|uniref:IS5 family transposase n=1 Tax=Methyloglobulus morosus TaxID=1410681 RepID=UPI00128EB4E1
MIDWKPIEQVIRRHYAPVSDVVGRPAYPGLLLSKMLLVGLWHGGLSDEAVEDMANVNLHVLCFLGLALEDDVPGHSVLSRFRTQRTKAQAWDGLLAEINRQIEGRNPLVKSGCHVDAGVTHSPRKPKTKPAYEIVGDREDRDDEADAQADMRVVEVAQPGVDNEGRWLKKAGKPVFGYKRHTVVDGNGLAVAVETTPANRHDSQPFVDLVDKARVKPGTRVHADKAYCSKKHWAALKERGIKNGIQDKAVKDKPLGPRQLARNSAISTVRFVVERTFGSQQRWFGGKTLRYQGLAKAHAWHVLLA